MGNNNTTSHGGSPHREKSKRLSSAHHPQHPLSSETITEETEKNSSSSSGKAARSEKYDRITKQAGEVFGLGESPLLLRDDKKAATEAAIPRPIETEPPNARVATVGVKCKPSAEHLIPTLFRWRVAAPPSRRSTTNSDPRKQSSSTSDRPLQVMVGGSFNDWQLVSMKASRASYVIIIELPVGEHQYKFNVDGVWMHHPKEPTVDDGVGGFNNVIRVTEADAEVFRALDVDAEETNKKRSLKKRYAGPMSKEFGQEMPFKNQDDLEAFLRLGGQPPVLPPHLLQVILNKDTPLACEPTLLPAPNHVMVNHMYALSIKDNVIVMSATQRFRKKCVTTILYRPI